MRYIILLTASIFIFGANAQNSKHNIFGLDMDLDWYSLTNYSALAYFSEVQNLSTTYVVTDFDYHLNQVDIELENFNFGEYLIAFDKGAVANRYGLEILSPLMFLGRYTYPNNSSFKDKGFNDAEFLKNKLMKLYGEPELNIEKSEFRVYKWEVDDVTIIVNSVQNQLMTVLTYMVNSR